MHAEESRVLKRLLAVRLGIWLENTMWRRSGNPFRTFVHPPSEMMQIIERARSLSDLVVGERPPRDHLLRADAPRNRLRRVYSQGPPNASQIIPGAGSGWRGTRCGPPTRAVYWNAGGRLTVGLARDADRPALKPQFMPTLNERTGRGKLLPQAMLVAVAKRPIESVSE